MTSSRKIILVILGVGLGLVAGLVGLRLTAPDTPPAADAGCQPAPGSWEAQARALLHDYRTPCADFHWLPDPGGEFYVHVRLNNFGLHAPDYTLAKPPGVYRIVVVGDSFPQGLQVEREQTFPALLQDRLNRESSQRVEVINLSMDAYGTDRELLMYALLGWQFDPDLVLLAVYAGNDIQDNQIDLEQRRYGYRLERPFFTLAGDAPQLHNSPVFAPEDYPTAPVFEWLVGLQQAQTPPPPENPPSQPAVTGQNPYQLAYPVELGLYLPEDSYWSDAWALTEALLIQFRDVVARHGIPFVVALIPDRRAVQRDDWSQVVNGYADQMPALRQADPTAPTTRLETFLNDQRIPVLDLTWALRSRADSTGERLYFPGDGHFTPLGHAVTAERIAGWLPTIGLPFP